ncbi:hypothetical protein [Paramuribaculum intestinale]|uniref:hypothetical protein n=1 Tax=Paramuribaculum intestinale TaxID=2094151 RepID=UPI0025B01763|nr:hypothetical protein [Paramuribaculum intestinale]
MALSTGRYNEAGRVSSADGRALPLADGSTPSGKPLTGVFATPPSAYLRLAFGRIVGRWVWIPVVVALGCLIAGLADADGIRWIFAGMILAFCVYPIVMLHICMRSMVTSEARLCVAPKRILLDTTGIVVIFQKPCDDPSDECDDPSDEEAGGNDASLLQEKSSSPQTEAMVDDDFESVSFSDIVDVVSSRSACVLRLRGRYARYLIIPSDAFVSADGAARLMSATASAAGQPTV